MHPVRDARATKPPAWTGHEEYHPPALTHARRVVGGCWSCCWWSYVSCCFVAVGRVVLLVVFLGLVLLCLGLVLLLFVLLCLLVVVFVCGRVCTCVIGLVCVRVICVVVMGRVCGLEIVRVIARARVLACGPACALGVFAVRVVTRRYCCCWCCSSFCTVKTS